MDVMDGGLGIALQRRLGLLVNPAPGISPEIGATLDLGPMPELLVHQGWRRFMAGGQVGLIAAQNGQCQIRNPSTTMIVVVEQVYITCGITTEFRSTTFFSATDMTTVVTTQTPLDTRVVRSGESFGSSSVVSQQTTGAPFFPASSQLQILAGTNVYPWPGTPVILGPGAAFSVTDVTVNQTFDFTFVWRERKMITQAELVP